MSDNKLNFSNISTKQMLGLMALAYAFSFLIRMIWVWHVQDISSFYWNNELMINTNDGYFFASGVQKTLEGLHATNPRVYGWLDYGLIFFTTLVVKFTPLSLETTILYMPAIVSSLVVIPIILISKLYNKVLWGFLAALLGSITWSYYNRTLIGYYDTDMFSAMAPMLILFFLIKSTLDRNFKTGLYAAIAIAIYPFLYDAGLSIVYAMGIMYALYMIVYHHKESTTYLSLILIFVALLPFPLASPLSYIVKIIVLVVLYFFLQNKTFERKELMLITGLTFFLFLVFGNVFGLILSKIVTYTSTGTSEEGLHFFSVAQTVREAGKVLFFPAEVGLPYEANIAHRMMGSSIGLIVAILGYMVLVFRHKEFILALPLIGIGIFAHWGGLRFTVYAVPVAAMASVYILFVISEYIQNNQGKYLFIVLATGGLLYPNIQHVLNYNTGVVFKKQEVEDLVKLDTISDAKDYTFTWWDYGYPIWYYSNTSTLIDGGKHNHDNFIISKIMSSSSQQQVANLSRLAVETYVDTNYSIVADKLFSTKENPKKLLNALKESDYKLPQKTRDVYLYMPYKMHRIFSTVMVFGNKDLKTGKDERKITYYAAAPYLDKQGKVVIKNGKIVLRNGIVVDTVKKELYIGQRRYKINHFDVASLKNDYSVIVQPSIMNIGGTHSVVYLKSYNTMVVMDNKTYNSAYVQMFMLGKYDKNLFELVVSSPYSKIYKVKR